MNRLEQMYARWKKDKKEEIKRRTKKKRVSLKGKVPTKLERKKMAKQLSKNAVLSRAISILWRKIAQDFERSEKEILSAVK